MGAAAFAPRATDTVPRWRASAKLRRRTLAARLHALAERAIRELEAARRRSRQLREALEILKLTMLAERPRKRWHRTEKRRRIPLTEEARARVIADLRANGVDIARAPSEALADFIESCAPGEDPTDNPAFKPRKRRYSMRKRGQAAMLGRGRGSGPRVENSLRFILKRGLMSGRLLVRDAMSGFRGILLRNSIAVGGEVHPWVPLAGSAASMHRR